MGRIEEARAFLKRIGMPKEQHSDLCCYALLAMAGIKHIVESIRCLCLYKHKGE